MNRCGGEADLKRRLFGAAYTPIYVYAPNYVNWSAGIRALHYLCHALNENGFRAWLALHGPQPREGSGVNPHLNTPVLTRKIIQDHQALNMASIGIYPETVDENPLNAAVTIRWILNVPGLLGGAKLYKDDFKIAYSKFIAYEYEKNTKEMIPILFLPVVDLDEMHRIRVAERPKIGSHRILYCQKFRALGGVPADHGQDVVEIERFGKNAPTRSETLKLLATAKELIVYENTTIISEAQYLGIPVRCISNEWFNSLIAEAELGSSGVVWDDDTLDTSPDIESKNLQQKLVLSLSTFHDQLTVLAKSWEEFAIMSPPRRTNLPSRGVISKHTIFRSLALLRANGFLSFFRFARLYLIRSFQK